jgi:hypothetical protein
MTPTKAALLALLAYTIIVGLHGACTQPRPVPLSREPVEHAEFLTDLNERPDAGVRLGIPFTPGPNQKTPPCDPEMGEVPINGACYAEMAKRPPCGKLREHDGRCYRPIAKQERPPSSLKP